MVVLLKGLTVTLSTFHGTDELAYHLPTIAAFAPKLPTPDLHSYMAAQTPLFHLIEAVPARLFGLHVWMLRAVNVLFSYAMALVLYRLARRRLGLRTWTAFAVTAAFVLTFYVFGASFLVMTDSLGLLLALLAVDRLLALRSLGDVAVASAWICLAILTRQSYVFLVPAAAVAAWNSLPRRQLIPALAIAGASLIPFGLLALDWGALVPAGSDPASCAVCKAGREVGENGGLTLRSGIFTLALVAIYGAALFLPALLRTRRLPPWRPALIGGAVGAGLLLLRPMAPGLHDAGYLWTLSQHVPTMLGTSLLFWLFVPSGGAVLAVRWTKPGRAGIIGVAVFALFLMSSLATRLVYQKYFDPFAMLGLVLTMRTFDLRRPWDFMGLGILVLISVAYAASF
jgi:hypothetical protein